MAKFILFVFCFPMIAMAEIVSISGTWKGNQGVKELYPTPLGNVYRFTRCTGDIHLANNTLLDHAKNHPKDCNCYTCSYRRQTIDGGVLEIELPKEKRKVSSKRFLAIDFRVRAFPALSRDPFSPLAFGFIDSEKKIDGSKYEDLHGMLILYSTSLIFFYSTTAPYDQKWYSYIPQVFNPCYAPLSMRIVYDSDVNTMSVYMNNGIIEPKQIQKKNINMKMRHFGITTFLKLSKWKYRTEYLEVSDPLIYRFDEESELKKLPAISFTPYPYESYALDSKKAVIGDVTELFPLLQRHKNPDLQYAYALRYLYGSEKQFDPDKGLSLLEKAAAEKHVMALYQLGLCHFRGYGVSPDWKKAKKFLAESMLYGYTDAGALLCFMETETHGRPWFFAAKNEKLVSAIPGAGTHDDLFVRYMPISPEQQEMISPKLLTPHMAKTYIRKGQENPKSYYVDYLISKDVVLAYWSKAMVTLNTDRKKTLLLLQTAVEKGDANAFPYLLFWRMKLGETVSSDEFTPYRDLQYADDPLYWIVWLLVRKNDFPDMERFFSFPGFHCIIPDSWESIKSPESELLLGLVKMQNLKERRYLFLPDVIAGLNEAFEHLKTAAGKNNPIAQYWLGRFYFYDDLPELLWKQERNEFSRIQKARSLLLSSGRNGHLGAALLLAELELKQKSKNLPAIIATVEPFCKLKYPEAFYIKAQALLELNRLKESNDVCMEGIPLGEHRGWQMLALSREKQPPLEPTRKYWYQFVTADRLFRTADRYDFFWPRPYEDYNKWEREPTSPRQDKDEAESDKKLQNLIQEDREQFNKNLSSGTSSKLQKRRTTRR